MDDLEHYEERLRDAEHFVDQRNFVDALRIILVVLRKLLRHTHRVEPEFRLRTRGPELG
jgi:hypothetical protein